MLEVVEGALVVVGEDDAAFDLFPFEAVLFEEFSDHAGDAWGAEDAADDEFFSVFFDVADVHAELVDGTDGGEAAFHFDDDGDVVLVVAVEVDGAGADGLLPFDDPEAVFDEGGVFEDVVDDVGLHAGDDEAGVIFQGGCGDQLEGAEGDLHFLRGFGVSAVEDDLVVADRELGDATGGLPVDGLTLDGLVDEDGAVLFDDDEAFAPVEERAGAAVVVDEAVSKKEEDGFFWSGGMAVVDEAEGVGWGGMDCGLHRSLAWLRGLLGGGYLDCSMVSRDCSFIL